jgi:peptide chain release factor 2
MIPVPADPGKNIRIAAEDNMENYEIAKKLEDYQTRLEELKTALKLERLQVSLAEDEKTMLSADFYQEMGQAQKVLKRVKSTKEVITTYQRLTDAVEELELCFQMQKNEEEDLNEEIEKLIKRIDKELGDFEIRMLLSHEYDDCDAIVELHPGAGGTESQDWTSMLFRMYSRYAELHDFKFEVLDYQDGEEAGIKSVTFIVTGDKAYGLLKGEQGVHRLVRISPFDSNARRHTSFCACTVTPAIDDDVNIEIKPEDIRIDTYRSSGAGGQKVNKTDSAIRITHFKTGIVVTCQNERSQIQNKDRALAILKSKLYQLELAEQEKKLKSIMGESAQNSFGSQIRSYVFHPYSMIKDHRTNYEVNNIGPVMDGELDGFINAYLKSEYNVR